MTTRAGVATLLGIGDRLFGLVAITANDAWTVGAMLNMISSRLEQPLIEHWDGRRWSVIPEPALPGQLGYLYSLGPATEYLLHITPRGEVGRMV
jgi:hypothetical protein